MKILLAVDGSPYTKRMLAYIAAHEELLGKSHDYVALTAVAAVPTNATRFLDRTTLEGYYRDQAEEVLKPLRAFAQQQGWKMEFTHGHGPASEVIATYANREKVGLVVMGTHGHTALGNALLGSVATGVLARCSAPVLLVR